MIVSRQNRKTARELFRACCEGGRVVPERVARVADAYLAERPRGAAATLSELARLVRLDLSKRHAVIDSASPLDPSARTSLESSLHAKFGAGLTTEFRVRPDLVGGVRIQVGSDVWDGSIKGRLESLAKQF